MSSDPSLLQKRLLSWYRKNARDLPWRRTKDPYKIWVSEIMLQQTQVDTVIPYYQKWLKRFPTLKSLAHASQSEVLKYWAGLGYYRRARMLHEAAKILSHRAKSIVRSVKASTAMPSALCSMLPSEISELMKLPGVGRYTAGAIASIAFGKKTPVLDGNVIRILTRIFAIKKDVGLSKTRDRLWKIAELLLPDQNPGDFNQALMELGATVCFPENPRCNICPVVKRCAAHRLHRETNFPVKAQKENTEKIQMSALVLRSNGKVLIQKQSEEARWGGLWTFPFWKDKKSMLHECAIDSKELKHRLTLHHGFTKYRIQLDVYELRETFPSVLQEMFRQMRWVRVRELGKFAFPSPHQKIVKELIGNHA